MFGLKVIHGQLHEMIWIQAYAKVCRVDMVNVSYFTSLHFLSLIQVSLGALTKLFLSEPLPYYEG